MARAVFFIALGVLLLFLGAGPELPSAHAAGDHTDQISIDVDPVRQEHGPECANALDEDWDGRVNDGCPAVGAAETPAQCTNTVDNDADTFINDGCATLASPVDGSNGVSAAGDRNADTVPDAEGAQTNPPCDGYGLDDDLDGTVDDGCTGGPAAVGPPEFGLCGNNLDDDAMDLDGSTLIGDFGGERDFTADDGCVVTLSPWDACIEIIDDNVLDAGEDIVSDRAFIDVTVGSSSGGGIPGTRPLTAFGFTLNWDVDVVDVVAKSGLFLIVSQGGGSPFSDIAVTPTLVSPFGHAISDAGPYESGAGVLSRVTIEGNAAGLADLTLTGLSLKDPNLVDIPIDTVNNAQVAVSKDGADPGTVIGDSAGEEFHCPGELDLVAIDIDTAGNGVVAAGDRDGDSLADAEGAADPANGAVGVCVNGIDDDQGDWNGSTTIGDGPGEIDGVADDGCVVPLSTLETCAEVVDDGVLNADEDVVDRVYLDVTVDEIPTGGPMSAFQFSLNWDNDVLDVTGKSSAFLIHAAGAANPFNNLGGVPQATSPFTVIVGDAGPPETGPGVLSRITVQGSADGVARLSLSAIDIRDITNNSLIVKEVRSAFLIVDPAPGGCDDPDADGVINALDLCPGSTARPDLNGCSDAQVDGDGDLVCNPGAPSGGPSGCIGTDNCPNTSNSSQTDAEQDGVGDICDNCPTVSNAGQADAEGDGAGDACDNCPTTPNNQANFDGDPLGDACDPDVDGDAVDNSPDLCPFTSLGSAVDAGGCSLVQVDGDLDGLCNPGAPSFGPPPGCMGSDNCRANYNPSQTDFEGDGQGDICDADDDNDGIADSSDQDDDNDGVKDPDEAGCGGATPSSLRPERLDLASDDDGDAAVDEALPPGSEAYDCDGDGWTGTQEALLFGTGGTVSDQDACGNNGWPYDLDPSNSAAIGDINSFVFPLRPDGSFNKITHPVPDVDDPDIGRWDIDPGDGTINIGDLNALNPAVMASTARPPMLGGQPAFFAGACPWPP